MLHWLAVVVVALPWNACGDGDVRSHGGDGGDDDDDGGGGVHYLCRWGRRDGDLNHDGDDACGQSPHLFHLHGDGGGDVRYHLRNGGDGGDVLYYWGHHGVCVPLLSRLLLCRLFCEYRCCVRLHLL